MDIASIKQAPVRGRWRSVRLIGWRVIYIYIYIGVPPKRNYLSGAVVQDILNVGMYLFPSNYLAGVYIYVCS